MQMRHFLMAVRTCIGEQAITACHKPRITGHLAHSANKTGDFGIRSLSGNVIPTDIRALGNDQDLRWGLRIDVVEGKGEFTLINIPRPEARRVGKECGNTCRPLWRQYYTKKKKNHHNKK